MDVDQSAAIRHQELEAAGVFPGHAQGRGVHAEVERMRVSDDLGLKLETGDILPAHVPGQ
ncbi:MAG: hypothetical protein U0835_22980 [Isosphaeraceae bacterium]